jgi:hypothetical protein
MEEKFEDTAPINASPLEEVHETTKAHLISWDDRIVPLRNLSPSNQIFSSVDKESLG